MMLMTRLSIVFFLSALLSACGGGAWGGGGGDDDDDPANAPSAPVGLASNAGDRAISLGWGIPTTNGSDSLVYEITVTPTASAAQFTIQGTSALITGLANGTTYTLAVTARNNAGTSPAASTQATPAAALANDYAGLVIANDPAPGQGVADPAPLRTAGGQIWLAYTSVDANGSGAITRSAIRLAHSEDNGTSYEYEQEVGEPSVAAGSPSGRWHYRTPWLIEDSTDPDATRRFKLFAHKFFFNPNTNAVDYQRGAIAMWTAATPDGTWSDEESIVLGWSGGPAALPPAVVVNTLNAALQPCLWISQGSASVGSNGIDFAFDCVTDNVNDVRKIVLLRSADHAQSFSYVSTLLQPVDALEYDGESFGMPALLPGAGNAPLLMASPIDIDGNARGCVLFPIAEPATGKLFTTGDVPLALQTLPPVGDSSGACGWDRSIPRSGILMGNRSLSDYTIQATGKPL